MSIVVPLEGFGSLGGKDNLAFKVVNGYNTPPSNPTENTIWVNTGVVITSWVFSATQPTNPEQGMVWISTGASSPMAFNALKKNTIMMYPISAKIYNSGAWSEKEAKTYKNGAWVEWFPEGAIYCNGAFAVPVKDVPYMAGYPGSHSLGDGYFMLSMGTAGYTVMLFTDTKIDLTDFNTMTVEFNSLTPVNDKAEVMLIVNDEQNAGTPVASIKRTGVASATLTLNISTISGSYYLAISIYNTGRQDVKITDWRLNK